MQRERTALRSELRKLRRRGRFWQRRGCSGRPRRGRLRRGRSFIRKEFKDARTLALPFARVVDVAATACV